jgi:hypothetical protein
VSRAALWQVIDYVTGTAVVSSWVCGRMGQKYPKTSRLYRENGFQVRKCVSSTYLGIITIALYSKFLKWPRGPHGTFDARCLESGTAFRFEILESLEI